VSDEPNLRMVWRDAIRDTEDPAIDGLARAVAFALDRHMSHDGRTRTGVRRLARLSAIHTRTVLDRLDRLEAAGWLRIDRPGHQGGSSRYQATIPGASAPVAEPRKVRAPNAHSFGGTKRETARSQSESARSRSNGQRKVRAPSTKSARPQRADPGRSRKGDPGGPGANGNARPGGRSPAGANHGPPPCGLCGATDHREGSCPRRQQRRSDAAP
jgi:hypothetical protein